MLHSNKKKKTKRGISTKPVEAVSESQAPATAYIIKALVLDNGSCPIEEWLKGIKDVETKQRIQTRLDRIERGNFGDTQPVGEGIFEFRLMFGPGYRIYYVLVGTAIIVLLSGGGKGSQEKDIAYAKELWRKYKDDAQRYERDIRR